MAHRAVGAGKSIATSGTASTTAAFSVQSSVFRIAAIGADAMVAIGADPVATTTDYYIPAGTVSTLGVTKASQRVVGITTGTSTIIDCPEGTQFPFGVNDRVTLEGSNFDSNYSTLINNSKVISVNTTSGIDGYFMTRITVDADTSGIITAFSSQDASLRNSLRVSAITYGGSGSIHVQQVQITGVA